MRAIVLVLLLAACSPQGPQEPAAQVTYASEGRDRLCLKGERAGFITYAEGAANCSVRGRVSRTGDHLTITPEGDQDCRIPADEEGDIIRLGKAAGTCDYYCGPGASFADKAFTRAESASGAVDFAGDPLC